MKTNRREVYAFLTERGLRFEITEHGAVHTMEELAAERLPYPAAVAKNLFVRDDRKRSYYLITVKGDKRVDLKAFRRANGTRPLSFASADELMNLLGLTPGSVTPLGLLQDESRTVEFCIDADFYDDPAVIGCHPNDNTATVWLDIHDLIALIEAHGNKVRTVKLEETQ